MNHWRRALATFCLLACGTPITANEVPVWVYAEISNIEAACADQSPQGSSAYYVCAATAANTYHQQLASAFQDLISNWQQVYGSNPVGVVCGWNPEVCQYGGQGYDLLAAQYSQAYVNQMVQYYASMA